MDRVFSFLCAWAMKTRKEKLAVRTEQTRLIRCLLYVFADYFGFEKVIKKQELEVRTATYGPGIDQSQHAKSVSHIINYIIVPLDFIIFIIIRSRRI